MPRQAPSRRNWYAISASPLRSVPIQLARRQLRHHLGQQHLPAPEAALKRATLAGRSHAETSRLLGASEDLVRWRWAKSGIDRYLSVGRR